MTYHIHHRARCKDCDHIGKVHSKSAFLDRVFLSLLAKDAGITPGEIIDATDCQRGKPRTARVRVNGLKMRYGKPTLSLTLIKRDGSESYNNPPYWAERILEERFGLA